MKNLTIRGIPDELHAQLKERASANRRSLNQQVIAELMAGPMGEKADAWGGRAKEMEALVDRLRKELPLFATAEEIDEAKRYGRK